MINIISHVLTRIPPDITIIPGHGAIGNKSDLKTYFSMLMETTDLVRGHMAEGKTLDQIKAAGFPEKFEAMGEGFVTETVARYKQARDLTIDRLQAMPKVRVHRPDGAFYAFFAVDGMTDSLNTCKEILRQTHVGLAPGAAFGPQGEGFIRLCFASTLDRLEDAMDRLEPFLG